MTARIDALRLRIFLVENHEDTLKALSLYLEQAGHSVRRARSLEEALHELPLGPCDVLLSDIGLPDGTGRDLLRALALPPRVYTIAISGYGAASDIAQSRAAGFRRHLVKPLDPDLLDALLEEAVRELPAAAPAGSG